MSGTAVQTRPSVPFVDLHAMHRDLADAVLTSIRDIIASGAFVNGAAVEEFEAAFAEFCGATHCVAVSSGLDALRLALLAAGLEPGDEVLVPANTFIASFEAITQAGGVPVPVDASRTDYNLDVELAAEALTPRTRFVMPVHLYGQIADMRAIEGFASEHGLTIIEDACQAHGARREGHTPGSGVGSAVFSFYPAKNLGAFGDAGALVTRSERLAAQVRALREHGQTSKYHHRYRGWTARMDTIQAAVLLHKLPHVLRWNEERQQQAAYYTNALQGIGDLELPPVPEGSEPVWHLYVVASEHRDALAHYLRERDIATGMHYPEPPHLSEAYRDLGYSHGSFPVTERLAERCLSLPISPGLSSEQLEAVVAGIECFFARG